LNLHAAEAGGVLLFSHSLGVNPSDETIAIFTLAVQ